MKPFFVLLFAVFALSFEFRQSFYEGLPSFSPKKQKNDEKIQHFSSLPNLNDNDDEYSSKEAYEKILLAYSAYCKPQNLSNWSCYWCKYGGDETRERVEVIRYLWGNTTNSFGWIGHDSKNIYFAFRGTQGKNFANWLTDLNFPKITPYRNDTILKGAFVHRGFAQVYLSIAEEAMKTILHLKDRHPQKNIVIVGHSLGAAIGGLAAVDLAMHYNVTNISMWSFGLPRMGNTVFSDYFEKVVKSWRITNMRDAVPHLPPQLLGFNHITREVWYPTVSKNHTICSSTVSEDPNCSNSVWYYWPDDHRTYLGLRQDRGGLYGC